MLNARTLDELAARIGKALEGSPVKDLEKNVKAMLASGLARLDLVTRQEFDTQAEVLRDDEKAATIWKKTDDMWWPDGPEDPNVRVLRLVPETAELWDGPSNAAVAAFEFGKARLTGKKPNLGENRKVTVKMT